MKMFAVILPLLCFMVLLKRDRLRESFLDSAVALGVFVVISTEALSLLLMLDYAQIVVCWFLCLLALVVWKYHHRCNTDCPKLAIPETTMFQKIMLTLMLCVVTITGITAVVAAPNNFDSLTYHLPRMMHWIQNRSVEHYPTHIDRQLWMAPFAEYVIMHLQILSGGDRFANCVQWFSMIGSGVAASLIVRELHGSRNSQIVAAALSVSIPMGLLQSTSTQNDYVVSFWLVCFTYYVVKAKEHPGLRNALYLSLSLALAIFTKGTAYLVAVPFMLLYLWFMLSSGLKTALTNILIIALAVLVINGSHYARNIKLYENPISPASGNGLTCKRVDPSSVISGVTKNIAIQLTTGAQVTNNALFAATKKIHNAIRVDVNDSDLTEGRGFFMLPKTVLYSEDFAPNPLHMAVMLLSAALLIVRRGKYSRETILLATATISSFIILSAGIKWNLFISRIFLSVFVISAPCIALLYDEVKLRFFINSCAIICLLVSFNVLINNTMRPLTGEKSVFVTDRIDQYFMVSPRAKPYFITTANMIKRQPLSNIGILDRDGNMWEYILWVLLKENGVHYRIEHVNVENGSGKIRLEGFSEYFPVQI